MMKKRTIFILLSGALILVFVLAGVLLCKQSVDKVIREDLKRLEEENYDSVFFSMYPTDHYKEEEYMRLRGMQTVRTACHITGTKLLRRYMKTAAESVGLKTVYLGIDPLRIAKEDVVLLIQENPGIMFEVVPAYPKVDYWLKMSPQKCAKALETYQLFAEWISVLPNAGLYFFAGEEWLICNPGNYEDTFLVNEEVSVFLMGNMDVLHPYRLTAENAARKISDMSALIEEYRSEPKTYPKGEDMDIVFLGDSIIGNYTNSMSIPGVVEALTGARVYNCGYGGKGAALSDNTRIHLFLIAEKLGNGIMDGLPEGEQLTKGLTEFINREQTDRKVMFVINYGLNDYFDGVPVESEDAEDISTYSGAIRKAVRMLQEEYPEARILLMSPNFTIYYENGITRRSEQGGILAEYADAVLRLAKELETEVLDNFHELPTTAENWKEYLADGCHLNVLGRFLVGERIAEKIQKE